MSEVKIIPEDIEYAIDELHSGACANQTDWGQSWRIPNEQKETIISHITAQAERINELETKLADYGATIDRLRRRIQEGA